MRKLSRKQHYKQKRIDPSIPSLKGFDWTIKDAIYDHASLSLQQIPGNGWCIRDAFCELLNWPEHSDEWNKFIEDPILNDVIRLGNRLGLHRLLWDTDEHRWLSDHPNSLRRKPILDHPGVVIFLLESLETFHCIFHPDLRFGPKISIWL